MDANNPKIKDLIENEEKYIRDLMTMPDKMLDKSSVLSASKCRWHWNKSFSMKLMYFIFFKI